MTLGIRDANIFLSASFPSGERGEAFRPYDSDAIASAVSAVVQAVLLAGGSLVTGAHPTISPLILLTAGELDRQRAVHIYQSAWFDGSIPEETLRLVESGLGVLHWTERIHGEDTGQSLAFMRETMFGEQALNAAVFVGGMEGILDEYELLARRWPLVPRLPITAPGGAARGLRRSDDPVAERVALTLASPLYPQVARSIVSTLSR